MRQPLPKALSLDLTGGRLPALDSPAATAGAPDGRVSLHATGNQLLRLRRSWIRLLSSGSSRRSPEGSPVSRWSGRNSALAVCPRMAVPINSTVTRQGKVERQGPAAGESARQQRRNIGGLLEMRRSRPGHRSCAPLEGAVPHRKLPTCLPWRAAAWPCWLRHRHPSRVPRIRDWQVLSGQANRCACKGARSGLFIEAVHQAGSRPRSE